MAAVGDLLQFQENFAETDGELDLATVCSWLTLP